MLYYVILIHFDSIKEGNIVFGNYARHWGFPIIYTYFALKCVLLIIFCSECYHFQSLGPYNMLQHMEEGWKPTYKAHNELESLWSFLFKTDLVYFWSFFVLGFTPWKLILFVSSLLSHDGQYLNPLCANFHLTYIKTLYLTGWFLGTPIKMHKTVDLVVTIYERVLIFVWNEIPRSEQTLVSNIPNAVLAFWIRRHISASREPSLERELPK